MPPKTDPKPGPPKKTMTVKLILALIVILVLLTFFLIPAIVSGKKCERLILAKINAAIDGRADFADLAMGWFRGVRVDDLTFKDTSGQTSIEVKRIATKPHYGSLLTGSLSFGKTVIDEPRIKIDLKPPQTRTAPHNSPEVDSPQKTPSGDKAQPVMLPIKRIDLVVNKGSLTVTSPQAKTVELSQINSHVNLRPPGSSTDFDVNTAVVDQQRTSKVHARGRIKPNKRTGWSLKGTTGNLTVKIDDLDIGSLAPLLTWAGVDIQAQGRVSADIKSRIKDGGLENLTGTVKAANLDVTGPALKGDRLKTDVLDMAVNFRKEKDLINIEEIDFKSDWANARLKGVVPTTFKSWEQFVKPDTDCGLSGTFQCDLAQALSQMPRTFGVKEDMKIVSGQLTGNIETSAQDGKKLITGSANLAGLAGIVDGKTVTLSKPVTAAIRVTSDKEGIKYDSLEISAPFAKINCTGTGELLEYNADINLEQFQSQLGQFMDMGQYRLAGELSGSGRVSTGKGKINAAGSSSLKDLRLTKDALTASQREADIDFDIDIDRENGTVDIAHMTALADLGRITIKDSTFPFGEKPQKPLKLAIAASDLDLQKLQPFAVLFASFPKDMQLEGMAESRISVTTKKDTYTVVSDATRIRNLAIRYPQQEPFEQDQVLVDCDVELNPALGDIAVKKLKWTSPQMAVNFKGDKRTENGKTSLQGRADYEYDWAAVSTVAAPYLPAGLKLYGTQKNTISFTSDYPADQPDGLLANLNANTKVGFDRAEYMGLRLGTTETDVRIQQGLMTISPFSTTLNNGQLNFAALADFKQKPTLLKTPEPIHIAKDVQIDDEVGRNLLSFMNPIFWNAFNINGVANFDCEKLAIPLAEGSTSDLEVVGTVSIDRLQLQPTDLLGQILSLMGTNMGGRTVKIHPTRFALQNSYLRYDDMHMDIGDKPVNFRGVIGIEDKSLDMTVTLPYSASGQRISVPLTGTIDSPELDVGRLLQDQFKTLLQEELRKGLQKLLK